MNLRHAADLRRWKQDLVEWNGGFAVEGVECSDCAKWKPGLMFERIPEGWWGDGNVGDRGEGCLMDELVGKTVVVDVESPFVYVGRLHAVRDKTLVLKQADVHDMRDSTTTREVYVRDAHLHGIQANRKTVYVRLEKVVSVAAIEDVIP